MPHKPQKPSDSFPLFAHACGKWAKKIDGKVHYFGTWENPVLALEEYRQRFPEARQELTLSDAIELFLSNKREAVESGIICLRSWQEYSNTCSRLVNCLGATQLVAKLKPEHFTKFKTWRLESCNLLSLRNEIVRVRTLFKWLASAKYATEPDYGPGFQKPSARALRRERREKGKKLFTREQVLLLLDEAGIHLRAMILLGINGGLGPTDCAQLPLTAVDLENGWLDFPRPKTEVERRIPLWAETVRALKRSFRRRYQPATPAGTTRFFIMPTGKTWDNSSDPIIKQFRQARSRAGIRDGGFYWLRHTFATVASGSKDQVAINAIMGHVDGTMAGVYREEIDDERLIDVAEHVRRWLFSSTKTAKP